MLIIGNKMKIISRTTCYFATKMTGRQVVTLWALLYDSKLFETEDPPRWK